jgi:hypothetical protein
MRGLLFEANRVNLGVKVNSSDRFMIECICDVA